MDTLTTTYRLPLGLLTDQYELTMAYGYWKNGLLEREAAFDLFFRTHPFGGGYTIACGLDAVVEYLRDFRLADEEIAYLRGLKSQSGDALFDSAFLDYMGQLRLQLDVDAIPEGTVVFPYEPLVRVRGPLLQAQILETALLTLINFPSLVATKAARICWAAEGDPVLEFGLRRAQGVDGGLTASRAAYVGGCAATSNLLAGRVFGIPVKGTHAHSWIMCFDDEAAAFRAFAEALPDDSIFLVDTYDTRRGVDRAIEAGKMLRERGHDMRGIRLDSGDLAYLSQDARKRLDAAGFEDALIVGSNDLDEHVIASLKDQGAAIGAWGVGTRLATAFDDPALGGIYKLVAVRDPGEPWQYKVKVSEEKAKSSVPGILQVRRFEKDGAFRGDMIYSEPDGIPEPPATIVDPTDETRRKTFRNETVRGDLLVPLFRGGTLVYDPPSLETVRARVQNELGCLHPGIKRFVNPHRYPAGLEEGLHERRTQLILAARGA